MHISRSCVVFAKTIELNAERFISMDSAALFRTSPVICSLVLSSFTTPQLFFFFFFLAMGLSCVSYVPIHCRFIGLRWFVFSLLFFFSNLISSSCSNLSSSNFHISLLFFYLLHPASTILLVPLLSSFSSLYSNYNKTSKILNKINNN